MFQALVAVDSTRSAGWCMAQARITLKKPSPSLLIDVKRITLTNQALHFLLPSPELLRNAGLITGGQPNPDERGGKVHP